MLARIISRVPARAFELKAGARNRLLEFAAALLATLGWGVADPLNNFNAGAALLTNIFVDWHNPEPPEQFLCRDDVSTKQKYVSTMSSLKVCSAKCEN